MIVSLIYKFQTDAKCNAIQEIASDESRCRPFFIIISKFKKYTVVVQGK